MLTSAFKIAGFLQECGEEQYAKAPCMPNSIPELNQILINTAMTWPSLASSGYWHANLGPIAYNFIRRNTLVLLKQSFFSYGKVRLHVCLPEFPDFIEFFSPVTVLCNE